MAVVMVATTLIPTPNISKAEEGPMVLAESTITLKTEKGVQYPVSQISITQGYRLFHPGIDLDGVTGDTIRPIMIGVVEAVQRSKYAYGNAVYIDHKNGFKSLYAHLSKILVKEGDEVTMNTVIGEMGATGRSYGDHLHLEVHQNGVPINPISVLPLPKI
jgi:murein DD-endopeptidase MepM/ murein hydrolase activator NlpD